MKPQFTAIAVLLLAAIPVSACGKSQGGGSSAESAGSTTLVKKDTTRLTKEEIAQRFKALQANVLPFDTEALNPADMPRFEDLSQLTQSATPLQIGMQSNLADGPAPTDIDLSEFDTPPKDQETNGWCTAFATVSAMENLANQGGHTIDLSETDLWMKYQHPRTDEAVNAASTNLIIPEDLWAYDTKAALPGAASGGLAQITDYQQITAGVQSISAALAAKHPVVFALEVSSTFQSDYARRRGLVSTTGKRSQEGHAIELVGIRYSSDADGGGYFVIKNSWGDVGDSGYGYIPFNYCKNFWCYAWEIKGIDLKTDKLPAKDPVPSVSNYQAVMSLTAQANGYHAFSLALDPNSGDMSKVDHVVYHVDASFGDAEFANVHNVNDSFKTGLYSTRVNHWSTAEIKIYLKDGTVVQRSGLPVSW